MPMLGMLTVRGGLLSQLARNSFNDHRERARLIDRARFGERALPLLG